MINQKENTPEKDGKVKQQEKEPKIRLPEMHKRDKP